MCLTCYSSQSLAQQRPLSASLDRYPVSAQATEERRTADPRRDWDATDTDAGSDRDQTCCFRLEISVGLDYERGRSANKDKAERATVRSCSPPLSVGFFFLL
jgi:hypothetical protein